MRLGSKNRHGIYSNSNTHTHRVCCSVGRVPVKVCVLRCCTKEEVPVEAQMVTDGLETNQPGSQDLCPETSRRVTYVRVNVLVCICAYVECVVSYACVFLELRVSTDLTI